MCVLAMGALLAAPLLAQGQQSGSQAGGTAMLFEKHCYSCHNIGGGDKTGPDLMNLTQRRTRQWLHRFIPSPTDMKRARDPVAAQLFSKYAPEVMPDQTITPDQIDQILDLIDQLSRKHQTFIPQTGRLARKPLPRDIPAGRMLFVGQRRLADGGPACIGCHSVAGVGFLSGGTLGPDLTDAALKYKDVELASILKAPAFPTMSKVFGGRALSDEEVVQLFAFLQSAKTSTPDAARAGFYYFIIGAAGAIAFFGFAGAVWKGRLQNVRKALVRMAR